MRLVLRYINYELMKWVDLEILYFIFIFTMFFIYARIIIIDVIVIYIKSSFDNGGTTKRVNDNCKRATVLGRAQNTPQIELYFMFTCESSIRSEILKSV